MRVLLISFNYAPQLTPRAFRWTAIAEHWAAQGHSVTVVCGPVPGAPERELRNGVDVIRCGGSAVAHWLRRRFAPDSAVLATGGAGAAAPAKGRSIAGRIVRLTAGAVRQVHRATWRNVYWPDYAAMWIRPATRAATRALAAQSYDAIITSSLPYSAHLVGLAAHARFPDLPWLVDIGDPFALMDATPVNNHRLYARRNFRSEARVLSSADAVTVTTDATRQRYAQRFPGLGATITVVPPLLSTRVTATDTTPATDVIRLVFVGTLYGRIRSPEIVLALFRRLLATSLGDRLELHFYGSALDCEPTFARYQDLIGHSVFLHGLVPRPEALQALSTASVIVNIGNETPYQLPSKLVEYVASGRPVLNFAASHEDSSLQFFADYAPARSIVARAADQIDQRELDELVRFIEAPPRAPVADIERKLAPFRVEAIATSYEALLAGERRSSKRRNSST